MSDGGGSELLSMSGESEVLVYLLVFECVFWAFST